MYIYILNLILTIAITIIVTKSNLNRWVSIILISLPLIIVSGMRYNVGTDFVAYYPSFKIIPYYPFKYFIGTNYNIPYERGFSILIWLIGLINKNPQFIVFITSAINIIPIIYIIKRYSSSITLSIYLYITSMIYYSAFNGIRQWIASVIIFCSVKYVFDRNFLKYLIIILVASCIHISSLIMIPIYFIVNFKPFSKKIFIVLIIFVLIFFLLEPILSKTLNFLKDTKYEKYMSINESDDGVHIFRVVVAGIPVIISYIYYNKLKLKKESNYLMNFSLINFLFLVVAMRSTVIARFNLFFEPYNLLLYSEFLKIFKKKERYLFVFLLCICFFAYMCLLLPVDSNLLPYTTFWER